MLLGNLNVIRNIKDLDPLAFFVLWPMGLSSSYPTVCTQAALLRRLDRKQRCFISLIKLATQFYTPLTWYKKFFLILLSMPLSKKTLESLKFFWKKSLNLIYAILGYDVTSITTLHLVHQKMIFFLINETTKEVQLKPVAQVILRCSLYSLRRFFL